MVLVDQPGDRTWPITGASFILIHKNQDDPNKAQGMLEFFDWCMRYGGQTAREMDYVPVPMSLVQSIERTWAEQIMSGNQKVWGN
jgi:phosphate transport system substrate-binding protein